MDIYTDGACIPNPGRGAWAYVVLDKNNIPVHHSTGIEFDTTNNRMELRAIIKALRFGIDNHDNFTIYSDSTYCIGLCERRHKAKKNKDLVSEVIDLLTEALLKRIYINFIWVKGHDGNIGNEFADLYAENALK